MPDRGAGGQAAAECRRGRVTAHLAGAARSPSLCPRVLHRDALVGGGSHRALRVTRGNGWFIQLTTRRGSAWDTAAAPRAQTQARSTQRFAWSPAAPHGPSPILCRAADPSCALQAVESMNLACRGPTSAKRAAAGGSIAFGRARSTQKSRMCCRQVLLPASRSRCSSTSSSSPGWGGIPLRRL